MTTFFFDKNKCGIGDQVEKSDFDFVLDCDIKPTPPPIFECLQPIAIDRDQEIPCPTFEVKSGMSVGYAGGGDGCPTEPRIRFDITRNLDNVCGTVNTCDFDVDFEIEIPIPRPPCPAINVKKFSAGGGLISENCGGGKNRFIITSSRRPSNNCNDPGVCEFDVELEIYIPIPQPPCPTIEVTKFEVKSEYEGEGCATGENRFVITSRRIPGNCTTPDKCEFDVELEIFVPIPKPPCPTIRVSKFNVTAEYDDKNCDKKDNRFIIWSRVVPGDCKTPDKCEFDIELEIYIPIPKPPCPEIKVNTFSVKSEYADENCAQGRNRFEIKTRHIPGDCKTPDKCVFDVDLEIFVPIPRPPCPDINVKTFKVETGFSNCVKGRNRFVVTKRNRPVPCGSFNEQDLCEFDIELEIVVPIPPMPCPIIEGKIKMASGSQECPSNAGIEESRFTIIPRHTPATCTSPARCDFEIELEIFIPLPPPPCPEIRVASFEINYVPTDDPETLHGCNRFEITTTTETECKTYGQGTPSQDTHKNMAIEEKKCIFDIDFSLCVPIVPCPKFEVKNVTIKSGYADCLAAKENKFIITKKDPKKCDFEFELEIYVPIPRMPCPIFNTALTVKTFLTGGGCVPGQIIPPCPAGGGPGGGVLGGVSSFTVSGITQEPDCGCDDGAQFCAFLFDLNLSIPIPKFVSEVVITPGINTIDLRWCPLDKKSIRGLDKEKFELRPKPQDDPNKNCCDRGAKVEFKPEIDILKYIPRFPCGYIDLDVIPRNVIIRPPNQPPELEFKILPQPEPPNEFCGPCKWKFDLQLYLPCNCRTTIKSHIGSGPGGTNYGPEYAYDAGNNDGVIGVVDGGVTWLDDCLTDGKTWVEIIQVKKCGEGRTPEADQPGYSPYDPTDDAVDCEDIYIIKPRIELPKPKCPCPVFEEPILGTIGAPVTGGGSYINIHYIDDVRIDPSATFRVVQKPREKACDPCYYDIQFDLHLHRPCLINFERGVQDWNLFYCKDLSESQSQSYIDIKIKPVSSTTKCEFVIDAYLLLGIPRPICQGTVYVNGGSLGTGALTCVTGSNGLEYRIDINLYTAPCDTSPTGPTGPSGPPGHGYSTGLPFTALPLQAPPFINFGGGPTGPFSTINAQPENLWRQKEFVTDFLEELRANAELRATVKELLMT